MTALRLTASLPLILASSAALAGPPLIVVEDHGGVPALPYYDAFRPPPGARVRAASAPPTAPGSADIEAQMLPVRSLRLSPGDEPRRAIRAPGLSPFFLVGDDDRSRAWLERRGPALRRMQAVGLVVNVAQPQALAALRRMVPGLTLMPVSGDDLARRLGIHHYPLLITADGVEP